MMLVTMHKDMFYRCIDACFLYFKYAKEMTLQGTERFLTFVSLLTLSAAGIFFIYEGIVLIVYQRQHADKTSKKVLVAGAITIVLGVISLIIAALHVYLFPSRLM